MSTRIQLCGTFHASFGGQDVTADIRQGQERALLAHLCLHRDHPVPRADLVHAIWDTPPPAAERSLAVLLSRLRAVLGEQVLQGRSALRLVLEPGAHVDVAVVREAIHRAEAAAYAGEWTTAWVAARIAHNIARRAFLPEAHSRWAEAERARLDDILLRTWACLAEVGVGLGGPELVSAVRAAKELIAADPLQEHGHRLLMRAHVAAGDQARALAAYARLRTTLAEELGVEPGPQSQELFLDILRASGTVSTRRPLAQLRAEP